MATRARIFKGNIELILEEATEKSVEELRERAFFYLQRRRNVRILFERRKVRKMFISGRWTEDGIMQRSWYSIFEEQVRKRGYQVHNTFSYIQLRQPLAKSSKDPFSA